MVTKTKAPAFSPVETFIQFMDLKTTAAAITKRSDALKKRLKDWMPVSDEVYENENGSIFFDLPETASVQGVAYSGMELRRSVSTRFDEEAAEQILAKKGVLAEAQSTLTFIDQDKVSRLQQEGKISEKDIDKMFVDSESFAFWPVKGEVI